MNENHASNIILIGMPGCGKSTCGVLAAKYLLKNFYDTDLLLQNRESMRLQDIINTKGCDYFEAAEEQAILSLDIFGTVIATGGSVVYSEKAMRHLKTLGKVIYLQIGFETMCSRIDNLSVRGVVLKNGSTLADMYDERRVLYERWADDIIVCDGNTTSQTAEAIVQSARTEKKA